MYHVLAYTANTFNQVNFDTTPVADSWVGITNGHYFPQEALKLFGGWFGGANLTQVTLVTPKARTVVPPKLYPINQSVTPPDRPHMWDRRSNPFGLNAIEEISLQMTIGGTANGVNTGILFVGESIDPVPPGDVYSLHFTSTTAAVANSWTQLVAVADQTIPAGNYTIIGSQHQSTNAIAHRINFRNRVLKPGMLSLTSLGNISDPSYYFGGWGALGTFNTVAYPFFEVYCNGTDNSHDIVINMIRTGP